MSYQSGNKLQTNAWITDPTVPDPENLPVPLGWCLLVRPYPVKQDEETSSIILPDEEKDFINHLTNIGRVVSIGDCCWTRPEHKTKDGQQKDWAKVGDFISYPKNVGAKRKFKGVSYVMLVDDEINELLPDPQVFDSGIWKIDIPKQDLEKYNTVYNPTYNKEQ